MAKNENRATIQDTGEKVWGAKKDFYAFKRAELEKMTLIELTGQTKKNTLWKDNKKALLEQSDEEFQPIFALTKSIIRDSIPSELKFVNPFNNVLVGKDRKEDYEKEMRIGYINSINKIRELLDSGKEEFYKNSGLVLTEIVDEYTQSKYYSLIEDGVNEYQKKAVQNIIGFNRLNLLHLDESGEGAEYRKSVEERLKEETKINAMAFYPILNGTKYANFNTYAYLANQECLLKEIRDRLKKFAKKNPVPLEVDGREIEADEMVKKIIDAMDDLYSKNSLANYLKKDGLKPYDRLDFNLGLEENVREEMKKQGLEEDYLFVMKTFLTNGANLEKNNTNENNKKKKEEKIDTLEKAIKQTGKDKAEEVKEYLKQKEIEFLSNVERKGYNWLGNQEATPELYLKDFGMKWVEYGAALTEKEKQVFTRLGYNALRDLALALNIDPKNISLITEQQKKGLSLGFATRGTGNAMAHYEQDTNIINLTKKKGAGSFAHEFGHALNAAFTTKMLIQKKPAVYWKNNDYKDVFEDEAINEYIFHLMYKPKEAFSIEQETKKVLERNLAERKQRLEGLILATSTFFNVPNKKEKVTYEDIRTMENNYIEKLKKLRESMKGEVDKLIEQAENAFQENKAKGKTLINLENVIFNTNYFETYAKEKALTQVHVKPISGGINDYFIEKVKEIFSEDIKTMTERNGRVFIDNFRKNAAGYIETMLMEHYIENGVNKDGLAMTESYLSKTTEPMEETDFLKSAKKLDALVGKSYYSQPAELFARAFETYVDDKLAEKGLKNDYLVKKNRATKTNYFATYKLDYLTGEIKGDKYYFFPQGEEREQINKYFDKMIAERFELVPENKEELKEKYGFVETEEVFEKVKKQRALTKKEEELKQTLVLDGKRKDVKVSKVQEEVKEIENVINEVLKQENNKKQEKSNRKIKGGEQLSLF